jgi:thiamine-monophosphate kinase
VENTHFRLDWATPEQAVEKGIVSNVSDISAMEASSFALLGICHNKARNKEIRDRIAAAFAAGFASRHIALIGVIRGRGVWYVFDHASWYL